MLGFGDGHADVERGEHGKDEGLDVGHKAFQEANEDAEEHGNHGDRSADKIAKEVAEDEDDDNEAQDDDVSGRHVGKQSDHKNDGFGEDSHQFDYRHQREDFEPCGHPGRIEDVNPIVLVATEVGDDKGDDGENHRYGYAACDVSPCREEGYQSQAVAEEDEEKEREQVGQVFFVFGTNHRNGDAVAHEDHEQFDQGLYATGSLIGAFLVACPSNEYQYEQQGTGNHDGGGRLGDGKVYRLDNAALGIQQRHGLALGIKIVGVEADDFLLGEPAPHKAIAFVVGMAMMET